MALRAGWTVDLEHASASICVDVDAQLLYSGNNKCLVGGCFGAAVGSGRSITTTSWMLAYVEEGKGFALEVVVRPAYTLTTTS